jgi:hypothetical protein
MARADSGNELGNIDMHGAVSDAGCIVAVKTAFCLLLYDHIAAAYLWHVGPVLASPMDTDMTTDL